MLFTSKNKAKKKEKKTVSSLLGRRFLCFECPRLNVSDKIRSASKTRTIDEKKNWQHNDPARLSLKKKKKKRRHSKRQKSIHTISGQGYIFIKNICIYIHTYCLLGFWVDIICIAKQWQCHISQNCMTKCAVVSHCFFFAYGIFFWLLSDYLWFWDGTQHVYYVCLHCNWNNFWRR